MRLLSAFLKLIRYPSLVYILLTQYLLQYAVIKPVFGKYGMETTLGDGDFFLLSLATILIVAAGYIINDYFDLNTDRVNRPAKIVIDRVISRRWAMMWHTLLNITSVLIGFGLAWKIGYPMLGLMQLVCTGLLWLYSTSYKRQLLVGNVVISLLTSLTVIVVGLYEPLLYTGITPLTVTPIYVLFRIIIAYAVFAFLISLVREMIKDLEDVKSDDRAGARTMPIIYGVNACRDISYVIIWFLIAVIVFVELKIARWDWSVAIIYLILLVQVPLLLIIRQLKKSVQREDFHKVSRLIKLVMLTGILSMVFFKIYW